MKIKFYSAMLIPVLILAIQTGLLSAGNTNGPVVLKDFAFGISLTIDQPSTMYTIRAPQRLYDNIDRDDFGDIRVFNGDRTPVPHSLKHKQPIKIPVSAPVPLAFFPVRKASNTDSAAFSLNINTDSSGAIINVQSDPGKKNESVTAYYLIDLSALKQMPEKLQFTWIPWGDNFSIRTTLESSNNLTDWTAIRTDSTLAALNFSGHELIKDKIELTALSAKYLRMSWPVSGTQPQITSVHALYPEQIQAQELEWKTIAPAQVNTEQNIIEYEIKGTFPLRAIALDFPLKNTVFKAVLKSRPDLQSEWRPRYSGLFYNIELNLSVLSNENISLNANTDRFWQLKFISQSQISDKISDKALPRLKIGWLPHDIYFLHQGSPPFTLAFGNWEIEPADNLVDPLFKNIKSNDPSSMVKKAMMGQFFPLGEKNIKTTPVPWKKWFMWSILIFGVIILGVMAVRLFRQMNI